MPNVAALMPGLYTLLEEPSNLLSQKIVSCVNSKHPENMAISCLSLSPASTRWPIRTLLAAARVLQVIAQVSALFTNVDCVLMQQQMQAQHLPGHPAAHAPMPLPPHIAAGLPPSSSAAGLLGLPGGSGLAGLSHLAMKDEKGK